MAESAVAVLVAVEFAPPPLRSLLCNGPPKPRSRCSIAAAIEAFPLSLLEGLVAELLLLPPVGVDGDCAVTGFKPVSSNNVGVLVVGEAADAVSEATLGRRLAAAALSVATLTASFTTFSVLSTPFPLSFSLSAFFADDFPFRSAIRRSCLSLLLSPSLSLLEDAFSDMVPADPNAF